MGLHNQAWLAVAILASIYVTLTSANRMPEWRIGSDPVDDKYMKSTLEGDELKLSCPSKGKPRPDTTWFKDNQPYHVPSDSSDRIRLKGINLKFIQLSVDDAGNYTCVAQNTLGNIEFTFILSVREKIWPLVVNASTNVTVFEGEDAVFYCKVLNDELAATQWLRTSEDDLSEDRFTFLESGDKSAETLVIHEVTRADEGQYTCLTSNGFGTKYNNMNLMVMEPTTTTTTTTTTSTTTTTTTTTTPSTTTTLPVPGAPRNIQVTRTSHNTMNVIWDAPSDSMYVQLYRVYYMPEYQFENAQYRDIDISLYAQYVEVDGARTSADIDYVDPYYTYGVRVQAQSMANVWGQLSDIATIGQYSMPADPTTMQPPTTKKPKDKKKKNKKKNKKDKKKDKKKNKKKDREREREKEKENNPYGYTTDDPYDLYNNYNNGDNDGLDTNDFNYKETNEYNTNTNIFGGGIQPNSRDSEIDPYLYGNDDEFEDNRSETYDEGSQGARNGTEAKPASEGGEIGVWTLYIIVGAVAGGVLLAGLVAIAIALCCQREEESQYKSTSV